MVGDAQAPAVREATTSAVCEPSAPGVREATTPALVCKTWTPALIHEPGCASLRNRSTAAIDNLSTMDSEVAAGSARAAAPTACPAPAAWVAPASTCIAPATTCVAPATTCVAPATTNCS